MEKSDLLQGINNDISILVETYKNQEVSILYETFNINESAKNRLNLLIQKMIEQSNSYHLKQISDSYDFCLKTVKLDKYGKLKESMSFPTFEYETIANETWLNSSLRKMFSTTVYVFAVFKNEGKELYLNHIKVWKMPSDVLDSGVREAWEMMRECITTGHIVKYIDDYGRYISFFPSSTDNPYVHVRPHAANRNDTYPLPVPDILTGLVQYPKHSFWLNRRYVLKIIEEE